MPTYKFYALLIVGVEYFSILAYCWAILTSVLLWIFVTDTCKVLNERWHMWVHSVLSLCYIFKQETFSTVLSIGGSQGTHSRVNYQAINFFVILSGSRISGQAQVQTVVFHSSVRNFIPVAKYLWIPGNQLKSKLNKLSAYCHDGPLIN